MVSNRSRSKSDNKTRTFIIKVSITIKIVIRKIKEWIMKLKHH